MLRLLHLGLGLCLGLGKSGRLARVDLLVLLGQVRLLDVLRLLGLLLPLLLLSLPSLAESMLRVSLRYHPSRRVRRIRWRSVRDTGLDHERRRSPCRR